MGQHGVLLKTTPRRGRKRRGSPRRWLVGGLKLWLGWLLLSTLLLNQPWIDDWINRKPVRGHVSWDFALSLLPGHVWAWGVDFRGHSRRQAFGFHATQASAWFVPWALFSREIRLAGLDAGTVAVAVRQSRVQLPPPEAKARPWTVNLPGIATDRLVSVQLPGGWHAAGQARARLDLRKVLSGGEFEIAAGEVDWTGLNIREGGREWVRDGRLAGGFSMGPMLTAGTSAWDKFSALRADIGLDLATPPLAWDEDGLREDTGAPAPGKLAGRLRLAGGRPQDGSDLVLSQPLHVIDDGLDQRRQLDLHLRYEGPLMRLTAALPPGPARGTVLAVDVSLPRADARQVEAIAAGRQPGASLAGTALAGATGTVDASLRFASLDLLAPWIARWRGLEASGEGWMHLRLRLADGQVLEESELRFEDAVLRLQGLGHQLEARVDGPLAPVPDDPQRRRLVLDRVRLLAGDGAVLVEDAGARLDLLRLQGGGSLLEAPRLELGMDAARVPDLRVFERYLPPGALHFGQGAATFSLGLALVPDADTASGHLALASDDAELFIGELPVRGRVSARGTLAEADLASGVLQVEGLQLRLDGLRFQPAGRKQPVAGWWLEATVPRAEARADRPLALAGQGQVAMRDLSLVLAMFAQFSDYPAGLLRLADAGQVQASGDFRLHDGRFELTGVQARNDRFTVDAGLQLARAHRQGKLLVQWGPLAVGVDLTPQGSKMKLLGARAWYEGGGD